MELKNQPTWGSTVLRQGRTDWQSKWEHLFCGVVCLLMLALLPGCSTVPDPYIPSTLGSFRDPIPMRGLELVIVPHQRIIPFRQDITFDVFVQNRGQEAKWIPREPYFVFYWIYPTGMRDNYVIETHPTRWFTERDAILLPPGHRMRFTETIPTHYFPRPGIMEFRAVCIIPGNSNQELQPFMTGRLSSNTYGVEFVR